MASVKGLVAVTLANIQLPIYGLVRTSNYILNNVNSEPQKIGKLRNEDGN